MSCVAPGCTGPAEVAFIAAEAGRMAGRDWLFGEEITLCWPHAADVYATQGVTDPADVAEWLRPEAAEPPNTWHGWHAVSRETWGDVIEGRR